MTEADAAGLCELWQRVWPQAEEELDPLGERAADFLGEGPESIEKGERWHLVFNEGRLAAVACSFLREIEFLETGNRLDALALASVCSDPQIRGVGLGSLVVRSVFDRVGKHAALSLYQTQVPGFYERFGAVLVENTFINSLAAKDTHANPWWDDHVMVYGDLSRWEEGRVDLRGAGY